MQFQLSSLYRSSLLFASVALLAPGAKAQNSIQIFGPVDVRLSSVGTGYGPSAVVYNSSTLNLTCPATPTATLSSTADGTGNLLVDNNINVTVISGVTAIGPTNVCTGGANGNPYGPFQNCFGAGYETLAGSGNAVGLDPDTVVNADGILPINIAPLLVPGPIQVKIDLQDEGSGAGFYLASSTLYLDTNCSQGGVTGPALINGNPISGSSPTPAQLSQDFSFNPSTGQTIGFEYDLTTAQAAGGLAITDQTIPQVGDSPLDPATFQSVYLPATSFATSNCAVHSGELLPSGLPACKLFTLQCSVGTGSTLSGAQCPVSMQNNEIFRDVFDGPAFTLSDIPTPGGPTFHEGIGFLMASENWGGGPCTYETAANLSKLPCPQNLLTSFVSASVSSDSLKSTKPVAAANTGVQSSVAGLASGAKLTALTASTASGSTNTSSGRTTRPNSTFITVVQVPEDLSTVTVAGQKPGYWNNSSTINVTLSSQPPALALTTLPGASSFVASPIDSISYGIAPTASVPSPGDPSVSPTVLASSVVCPTLASPTGIPASTFTAPQQTLNDLADGNYLIYYYAQDCAGTEELHFTQDTSNNWSTSFYTFPVNIDTIPPAASTPVLAPATTTGSYTVGQAVNASYNCTDALSGVTQCGAYTYAVGATNSTGTLTSPIDTSSPGSKTFTVTAVDAAGNQTMSSVNYQVISPYDNQIQLTVTPQTITYPEGVNIVVQILPGSSPSAARNTASNNQNTSGTVKILDGAKVLATLRLQGNGAAYDYISGLSAGQHSLSAVYSGSSTVAAGSSAPVTVTVQPAPVYLGAACWNTDFPYGAGYTCGVYTSSSAGPPTGSITYKYDNAASVKVRLVWGIALFFISKPPVGQHQVVVSYAAQGNFAAATPQTESFTVTPAPVNVSLTPSTYYLTGGALNLSAQVQSWSAGSPKSTGSVTFSIGATVLAVVPVNHSGQASLSVAASTLPNGSDSITATYAGGTNYGTGAASATIGVAHP